MSSAAVVIGALRVKKTFLQETSNLGFQHPGNQAGSDRVVFLGQNDRKSWRFANVCSMFWKYLASILQEVCS